MPYYLGIDGGGSKTTCAIGDESSVVSTATAGPSNIVRVGETQARESLLQCVRQACAAAGIPPEQMARTCVGAAGAARDEVAGTIRRILAEILPTPVDVVGDTEIALAAAFDSGPGVIVIGGTGSIAYGRDAKGTTARAGGWGFAISDEGSAQWIGRASVAAAMRAGDPRGAAEGAPADSLLLAALKESWGTASLEDFIRTANFTPPPDFSALLSAVVTSAEAGDNIAQQVLTQAGVELSRLAGLVVGRLFSNREAVHSPVPVAMIGGVFRHAPQVRKIFYNELRENDARVVLNTEVVNPVEGALRLARKVAR